MIGILITLVVDAGTAAKLQDDFECVRGANMISRILIPVEDSFFADTIAKLLAQLNFSDHTIFRLLHVIEPIDETLNWPSDQYRKHAEQLLSKIASGLRHEFPDVSIDEVILEGRAADTIIADAVVWEADLIVTGSEGKRGIRKFLLGSVANAVASNAPCSVLIVRPKLELPLAERTQQYSSATQ